MNIDRIAFGVIAVATISLAATGYGWAQQQHDHSTLPTAIGQGQVASCTLEHSGGNLVITCPDSSPGMMGGSMMGGSMMGSNMMGSGTMGNQMRDVTIEDVRHMLEHRLEMMGNERLRLGAVEMLDDDRIVAEIETVDGSLVERIEIDRHTGNMQHMQDMMNTQQ